MLVVGRGVVATVRPVACHRCRNILSERHGQHKGQQLLSVEDRSISGCSEFESVDEIWEDVGTLQRR